ncbi:MgtC/SapB family protein [Aequorivita sp. F47161]|uniref:MgtC/SapB family protein n=1 Tax=Aequorivita vitellina TaxID=2874475 RepID=A0A9X1QV86_9FLAO|nr:MgtC/SapB family protein [Aequorivita vitellina]MCG2418057.1 MgtC/SapB family protein [Aequorivita vitellina]MCZ4317601.1 MgtC/SapB family protein [Aequorivita viscosa]
MEFTDFAIRVFCALTAGFFIGIEREYKKKHAGLKTNMLVALGAAIYVLISLKYAHRDYTDITRVLSQVVIGIGFLGAGTILKRNGETIEGLTTAATIWCSAAVGCLAAFGLYLELVLITVIVVVVNFIFGILDSKIKKKNDDNTAK